jgi:hypothetical protein
VRKLRCGAERRRGLSRHDRTRGRWQTSSACAQIRCGACRTRVSSCFNAGAPRFNVLIRWMPRPGCIPRRKFLPEEDFSGLERADRPKYYRPTSNSHPAEQNPGPSSIVERPGATGRSSPVVSRNEFADTARSEGPRAAPGFVRRNESTIAHFGCAAISTLRFGKDATAKTALPIYAYLRMPF